MILLSLPHCRCWCVFKLTTLLLLVDRDTKSRIRTKRWLNCWDQLQDNAYVSPPGCWWSFTSSARLILKWFPSSPQTRQQNRVWETEKICRVSIRRETDVDVDGTLFISSLCFQILEQLCWCFSCCLKLWMLAETKSISSFFSSSSDVSTRVTKNTKPWRRLHQPTQKGNQATHHHILVSELNQSNISQASVMEHYETTSGKHEASVKNISLWRPNSINQHFLMTSGRWSGSRPSDVMIHTPRTGSDLSHYVLSKSAPWTLCVHTHSFRIN